MFRCHPKTKRVLLIKSISKIPSLIFSVVQGVERCVLHAEKQKYIHRQNICNSRRVATKISLESFTFYFDLTRNEGLLGYSVQTVPITAAYLNKQLDQSAVSVAKLL